SSLLVAGITSGVMGTMTTAGSPPMVVVLQKERAALLRTTMAMFLGAGAALSLTTLTLLGEYGVHELGLTMYLVPGVFIGYFASGPLIPVLDSTWTRWLVLVVAGASGVILLVRALV